MHFDQIGLPEIVAGIIVLALNAYVLTGGADFGGGVWDLFATGPRRDAQRQLIAESIAPIWEANHVWLIVSVVMLFTAFPGVFSILGTLLHIPLGFMLLGIVCRGSAFVFRSYGPRAGQHHWRRAFAIASVATPVFLGIAIGAVASGAAGSAVPLVSRASFAEVYVAPWFAPFPVAIGAMALALFAFLAAVYLCSEAHDDTLREDFRIRALVSALVVFVAAAAALATGWSQAPVMARQLALGSRAVTLHAATAIAAIGAIVALWTRRYGVARVAAAAQVSCILWGWAFAQFPNIVPPALTIRAAAAPRITLVLLLVGLAAGAAILIPSLRYLFRVFGDRRRLAA